MSVRKRISALITCFALAVIATIAIYKGWHTAVDSRTVCGLGLYEAKSPNSYLEFELSKQNLAEPIFNGTFRFNASEAYRKGGANILDEEVVSGGGRDFAPGITSTRLSWEKRYGVFAGRSEDTYFNPLTGSHHYFPFDSADFKFDFETEPAVAIPVVRIVNRVPGFYMPCETMQVENVSPGHLRVAFSLRRDILTRVTATLLGISAVIFAVAITTYVEWKSLPTAVASYFFTLWSARAVFALPPEAFPTLIDVAVLALCLFLLLLLAFRFFLQMSSEDAPS